MKTSWRVRILVGVLVVLMLIAIFQIPFGRITGNLLVISKETTYLTGPIRDDGGVSYLAHVNQLLSEGVTPENNALIALSKLLRCEIGYSGPEYQQFVDALGVSELRPVNIFDGHFEYLDAKYPVVEESDKTKRIEEFDHVLANPWKSDELPKWAEAVQKQNMSLDAIVEATRLPRYFHPYIGGNDDSNESMIMVQLPLAQMTRHAARGLKIRAMNRLGDGDIQKAIDDLKAMRRLASLTSQSGTLVEELIAIAINGIALTGEQQLIASGQMTAEQIKDYQQFLSTTKIVNNLAWRLENFERFTLLDLVQQQNLYGVNSDAVFPSGSAHWQLEFLNRASNFVDWNAAMIEINKFMDKAVSATGAKNDRANIENFDKLEDELIQIEIRTASLPNAIGSLVTGPKARGRWSAGYLLAVMFPATSQVYRAEIRDKVQRDLVQIALSLEHYKLDNGGYPAALEELTPNYIASVPVDRFNDLPLIYKPSNTGYLLYSVGTDGTDDGGTSLDQAYNNPGGWDVTFRVGEHESETDKRENDEKN